MEGRKILSLIDVENGKKVKIVKIVGCHFANERLRSMGIEPGQIIEKTCSHPLKGPCVIKKGATNIAIGHGIARKIYVKEVE